MFLWSGGRSQNGIQEINMASIFKEYDIRGIYGTELTEELAVDIGRAFVTFLGCKMVTVGRDVRSHSDVLFRGLTRGITMQGAGVIDLGRVSTPISYYGTGSLCADAGIMITASHNPKEYNGFKLSRAEAVPISGSTGIKDIEKIVNEKSFAPAAESPGKIVSVNVLPEYKRHVQKTADIKRPLKIAADMANGMGIYEAKVFEGLPLEIDALYDTPDGSFPNHEGNPLHHETLRDLQAKVREGGYAFGVAFDGDADRAGFIDEKGEIIPMDLLTAVIAQDILSTRKGAVIFYDLRSSWAVKETIRNCGGIAMMSRVGHAFIKQQMRDHDAVFAGELSGHYYFKANFTTESSSMAVISLANILSKTDKTLSQLVAPLRRYFASGEINTKLQDRAAAVGVMETLKRDYGSKGKLLELDGVSVEFPDWWFNVRCSNTEPLLRLNLEAKTAETMETKRDEILAVIRG